MDLCFTIVIKCENGYQVSYQLAYQPCPIWMLGDEHVINMCDDGLYYQPGAFQKLIDFHESRNGRSIHPDKICTVICDDSWTSNCGYDSNDTLKRIINDIENTGFTIKLIQF